MTNNNASRVLFSKFLEKYHSVVFRVDNRNVFGVVGSQLKFAFSVSDGSKIECRQFYEDLDGLLCVDKTTGECFEILKSSLDIDKTPNKITPTGIKAFSATADTTKATKSSFLVAL